MLSRGLQRTRRRNLQAVPFSRQQGWEGITPSGHLVACGGGEEERASCRPPQETSPFAWADTPDFALSEMTTQEAFGKRRARAVGARRPGHRWAESCKSIIGSGDASLAWGASAACLLQPERRSNPARSLGRSRETRLTSLPSFCNRLGTCGRPGAVFWPLGTVGGCALLQQ